jgi:hypothetical protein
MNLQEIKEQLSKAIAGYNSKSYTRILNLSYPELAKAVQEATVQFNPANLNESIYILLKAEPEICKNGKKPLFSSYEKGYRIGCGKASECECVKNSQKQKINAWYDSTSDEERERMVKKAKETVIERFGVDNLMHVEAIREKLKKTNQEKYGADSPLGNEAIKQKIAKTNMEKYGVVKPLESKEIQEKARKTTAQRYGGLMTHARQASYEKYSGNNPFLDEEVKEKRLSTMLERYNTPHALANKEIFDKMTQNNIEKYGCPNFMQTNFKPEVWQILSDPAKFLEVVKGKNSIQVSNDLNITSEVVLRYARKYGILDQMIFEPLSAMEDDLKEWLVQQDIPYKQHDRITLPNRKEIDFMFRDFNFGLELNSFTIHSELRGGKDSDYHFEKYNGCNIKNIHLLQYWQDEYWKSKSIIQSKILYLAKRINKTIHARKTKIQVVEDINEERNFLEKNHIQGFADYRQHSLGAYYDDQLIGLMSFALTHGRMELIRYATDISIVSPGLFTRLFEHSVKTFKLSGKITSLSDNRHSNGNLYLQSGWKCVEFSKPTYSYTDYRVRFNKQNFTKYKIGKKFNIDSETLKNYTEWEIVQELGYDRLWDAGKKRWILTV